MHTEYNEKALDFWKLPNGKYIVNFQKNHGLEDDNDVKNTLPNHLGAFIWGNTKRIINNYIKEINGLYDISIYYGDIDSLWACV